MSTAIGEKTPQQFAETASTPAKVKGQTAPTVQPFDETHPVKGKGLHMSQVSTRSRKSATKPTGTSKTVAATQPTENEDNPITEVAKVARAMLERVAPDFDGITNSSSDACTLLEIALDELKHAAMEGTSRGLFRAEALLNGALTLDESECPEQCPRRDALKEVHELIEAATISEGFVKDTCVDLAHGIRIGQAHATRASTNPATNTNNQIFSAIAGALYAASETDEAHNYSGDSNRLLRVAAFMAERASRQSCGGEAAQYVAFDIAAQIKASRLVPGDTESQERKDLIAQAAVHLDFLTDADCLRPDHSTDTPSGDLALAVPSIDATRREIIRRASCDIMDWIGLLGQRHSDPEAIGRLTPGILRRISTLASVVLYGVDDATVTTEELCTIVGDEE